MSKAKVFKTERKSDAIIVTPIRSVSELSEPHVTEELNSIRNKLQDEGVKNAIIDLTSVERVTSALLEVMLVIQNLTSSRQGRVACCNVSSSALEVIKLSRFDTLFSIHPNQAEAMQSFSG